MSDGFNYVVNMTQGTVKTLEDLLKMLKTIFEDNDKNKAVSAMLDHIDKKGSDGLNFTTCEDTCVKAFTDELEKRNIPYVQLMDNRAFTPVIVTRDMDIEEVKKAKQAALAREKKINEVSFSEVVKKNPVMNKFETIDKISDVRPEELEHMRERMAKENVIFTKRIKENGNIDIFFEKKYTDKVLNAYVGAKATLHSELGQYEMIKQETRKKETDYIMNNAMRRYKNEDMVVVSAKNPAEIIKIDKGKYAHVIEREDKEDYIKREFRGNKEDIQKGLYWSLKSIEQPVLMSATEYNQLRSLSADRRRSELIRMKKDQNKKVGTKEISDFERQCAEKQRMAKQLIEMKLMIDDEPITAYPINPYDDRCSFVEFVRQNRVNGEIDDERQEKLDQMDEMAEALDKLPNDVKDKVYDYLVNQQTIIDSLDVDDIIEEYEPQESDRGDDIEQFIESMSYEVAVAREEEEIEL